jgi:hypothetical protein
VSDGDFAGHLQIYRDCMNPVGHFADVVWLIDDVRSRGSSGSPVSHFEVGNWTLCRHREDYVRLNSSDYKQLRVKLRDLN